jgi:hypothetical protein
MLDNEQLRKKALECQAAAVKNGDSEYMVLPPERVITLLDERDQLSAKIAEALAILRETSYEVAQMETIGRLNVAIKRIHAADAVLSATPLTALAEYRRKVLEEVADALTIYSCTCGKIVRRMAGKE